MSALASTAVQSVPVLAVRGATKRFGAVGALDGIDLDLRCGEVLALLGDNGAGKSTLIKCLSGVHRLDSGTIRMDGEQVAIHAPADARALGIETVYQDLALFDNLRPTDNFYAGRELAGPSWLPRSLRLLKRRKMTEETREVLERLQVTLPDFNAVVGLMSGGQRQAVAVSRAAAFASKVVILDEPTAALGVREARKVLDLILRLREREQGGARRLACHGSRDGGRRPRSRAAARSQGRRAHPDRRDLQGDRLADRGRWRVIRD